LLIYFQIQTKRSAEVLDQSDKPTYGVDPREAEELEKDYQRFLKENEIPPDLIGRQAIVYWQAKGFVKMRSQVVIASTDWHEEGGFYLNFANPKIVGLQSAWVLQALPTEWVIFEYVTDEDRRKIRRAEKRGEEPALNKVAKGYVVILDGPLLPEVDLTVRELPEEDDD
jgi:hypothetical protein